MTQVRSADGLPALPTDCRHCRMGCDVADGGSFFCSVWLPWPSVVLAVLAAFAAPPLVTPCLLMLERQRAEAAEVLLRQQEARNERYMARIKDFQVS